MLFEDRMKIRNFCYTLYAFGIGDRDWYVKVLEQLNRVHPEGLGKYYGSDHITNGSATFFGRIK